jgi:hypothetical protein
MKKLFIVALAAVLTLAGCGTVLQSQPQLQLLTPAQLVAQVNTVICPVYGATAAAIETTPGIDPAVVEKLQGVSNSVDQVCAAGAALNAANLQTLADSSVPVILAIAQTLSPSPQRDAAIAAISAAKILLPILIAQVKAIIAAQPIPSAGTPSTATPAPTVAT